MCVFTMYTYCWQLIPWFWLKTNLFHFNISNTKNIYGSCSYVYWDWDIQHSHGSFKCTKIWVRINFCLHHDDIWSSFAFSIFFCHNGFLLQLFFVQCVFSAQNKRTEAKIKNKLRKIESIMKHMCVHEINIAV